MKKIFRVVRPGSTPWSEHTTLTAAIREARRAKQVTGLNHEVYGERPDGLVVNYTSFVKGNDNAI